MKIAVRLILLYVMIEMEISERMSAQIENQVGMSENLAAAGATCC